MTGSTSNWSRNSRRKRLSVPDCSTTRRKRRKIYKDMLFRLRSRNLPFICVNPDIVVERGERLIWCAGALARDYSQLGGRTLDRRQAACAHLSGRAESSVAIIGRDLDRSEVLAIGDGMMTDIKGASDNGFDVLYVSGGIHARDYGDPLAPDPDLLAAFLRQIRLPPRGGHAEAALARTSLGCVSASREINGCPKASGAAWWRSAISMVCIAAIRRCSARALGEAEKLGVPAWC